MLWTVLSPNCKIVWSFLQWRASDFGFCDHIIMVYVFISHLVVNIERYFVMGNHVQEKDFEIKQNSNKI